MPLPGVGARDQIYSFTKAFDNSASDTATTKTGTEREEDIRNLYQRSNMLLAHPCLEPLLPLAVCCRGGGV
jgi:hypothetical protein